MFIIQMAQTQAMDNPDRALSELSEQLKLPVDPKENSLAFVHCNAGFLDSGVVARLKESLPFPMVGIDTSLHSSSLGLLDNRLLTLSLLTSRNFRFGVSLTKPLTAENLRETVTDSYREAAKTLAGRPAMGLLYVPPSPAAYIGEELLRMLDEASDNLPFFGAVAADVTSGNYIPRIVFDGEPHSHSAAIVLLEGNIRPRFVHYPIVEKDPNFKKAVITDSDGPTIKAIDGQNPMEYLEITGLLRKGAIKPENILPIFLHRGEGEDPIPRAVFTHTPEGYLIMGGIAPVNTVMEFGNLNVDYVRETINRLCLSALLKLPKMLLAYSCVSRNFTLGFNYSIEMEIVQKHLLDKFHYLFSYSVGEICPVLQKDGTLKNRFHNMNLIACAFETL
ncbi:MAG: FIST C-terminal domain-containing protein [Deltaproteobacteria bacterium]|jgi:hypothetical protein|nr:FIST C-terminal domain-containing protein [Deltaproteobacteria bacterium]